MVILFSRFEIETMLITEQTESRQFRNKTTESCNLSRGNIPVMEIVVKNLCLVLDLMLAVNMYVSHFVLRLMRCKTINILVT